MRNKRRKLTDIEVMRKLGKMHTELDRLVDNATHNWTGMKKFHILMNLRSQTFDAFMRIAKKEDEIQYTDSEKAMIEKFGKREAEQTERSARLKEEEVIL